MAPLVNRGIYLGPNEEIRPQDIPEEYKPSETQVLVKVKYSGIKPADLKHTYFNLWGHITGYDWVGTVVEAGGSSPFKAGQTLFGGVVPGSRRPMPTGAHQNYLLADKGSPTWPVPKGMTEEVAATLPVAVETAVDLIFNCGGYGLPAAGLDGRDATGTPILIWGGASNVGSASIQLARAAGFSPIITTASPKNHDKIREIGATQIFDYKDPDVVDKIKKAVAESGKKLSFAIDTIGEGTSAMGGPVEPNNTADLAKSCISEGVPDDERRLASALGVPHDSDWLRGAALRPAGDRDWLGEPQDPVNGARVAQYMEWFVANFDSVWKPVLVTPVAHGVDEAIEQIKRVARGGASMEKVLIARPL